MSAVQLHQLDIQAFAAFDVLPNYFALLDARCTLHLYDHASGRVIRSYDLQNLQPEQRAFEIAICAPYIAVAERYGLNAVLLSVANGELKALNREDYHCNVSSYGIAFVRHHDQTPLLMHQTQWNRLDITDPENGHQLTQRAVSYKPQHNYLDYFHSQLLVSPSRSRFLTNGWHWSPIDNVRYGSVETFLQAFELSTVPVDYGGGYNWDRPATFMDDDTFAIAIDDPNEFSLFEADEVNAQEDKYQESDDPDGFERLFLYRVSDIQPHKPLTHYKTLRGDWFSKNESGEVSGRLYYAPGFERLIAISSEGIFAINPQTRQHTKIVLPAPTSWQFSREHQFFYTWRDGQMHIIFLAELLR